MSKKVLRTLCLVIVLAMAIPCFSGCSILLSGIKSWSTGTEETQSPDVTTDPATVEPTEAVSETTPEVPNTVTFTETSLVSAAEYTATAVSFDPDAFWGPTFTVLLENNTDKTLTFSIEDASVNGIMCDPYWACEVEPGKKANSDVSWMTETFAKCGINYINLVEFTLRVYDTNDWSADDVYRGAASIQVENSSALPPVSDVVYDHGFAQQTLVDNEIFTLTVRDYDPDGEWGSTLVCSITNKSDINLMFSGENVSVNGIMCDPYWVYEVMPGKSAYCDISWMAENLAKCGINYLSEVEFTLRATDSDDWTKDDIYNEDLSLALYNLSSQPPVSEVVYTHGYVEQTLVDNDMMTVIVKDFDPNGQWGPTIVFYCVNKTDKSFTFTMEGTAVNDFMCDPYWVCEVAPGKISYSEATWMTSTLESSGVTTIEKVDFTLRAYDSDDWYADDYLNEAFALTF